MQVQPIQFVHRGKRQELRDIPPNTTLLEALRDNMACMGTKEGCGEGDCGACTVVLAELENEHIRYKAINSCIRTAHSLQGKALWTVQDLNQDPLLTTAQADNSANEAETVPNQQARYPTIPLHPIQQALVNQHASQCGFCTPGFVMSLFAMYQHHLRHESSPDRQQAQEALSGNLCRCTGYRPILDAAQQMMALPKSRIDEPQLKKMLRSLRSPKPMATPSSYLQPTTLADLLQARSRYPKAQLLAGATDVGLWITKQHKLFERILDVSAVHELRQIETYPHHLAIGASVTLEDAFQAMEKVWPQMHEFFARFAGLPVRNSGTLGGNIANGSPIGDSMPLLIALGANVVLSRQGKGQSQASHREVKLEDLYTGYRTSIMRTDEVLTWIKIPLPVFDPSATTPSTFTQAYKVSKRQDDDISAVCLGLSLTLIDGKVKHLSIGAGGVAATPKRAVQTEARVQGLVWSAQTAQQAGDWLTQEFQPLSDLRASSHYRRQVLRNLMTRFWHESQGQVNSRLSSLNLEATV